MTDITANLELPYILPGQAQKHVTHNEGLQRLDAVVQLAVAGALPSPPPEPSEGDCYLIADGAAGAWSGHDGKLAFRQDGDWIFIVPRPGWRAWFSSEQRLRVFADGAWDFPPLPPQGTMEQLGIGASADTVNRLVVSSPASLFNNAGNGHQIKVNKATAADTASLLFQTGWSGRAEMGLAGDDAFSIKVSADGSNWLTGLSVSGQGHVQMPNRPLARASLGSGIMTPANGAEIGFDTISNNQGGFALGAAIGTGLGRRLLVPATGCYLISLSGRILASAVHSLAVKANGTVELTSINGIATGSAWTKAVATSVVFLNAGDGVSLFHTGTAQLDLGPGKTELNLFQL